MSKILRQLNKELESYKILITDYPEAAKANKFELLSDSEILLKRTQDYIASKTEELKLWGEISVQAFDMPDNNIFQTIKRNFWMAFVNHYLYKVSGELEQAKYIEDNFQGVTRRFNQYINVH